MKRSPEAEAAMRRLLTKDQIRRLQRFVGRDASGVVLLRWLLDHALTQYEADWERQKAAWLSRFRSMPAHAEAIEAAVADELAEIVKQHSAGGE